MNEIVISEKEKTKYAWKKAFLFALIFVCAAFPIFAQDATAIDGAVEKVTSFLSSMSSALGPSRRLPSTVGVPRIPLPILEGVLNIV